MTTPAYELKKERARAREAALSRSGRDIGNIPPVKNPERKIEAGRSFRVFCEEYGPEAFNLGWSPDHITVLNKVELVVKSGGTFALGMPRGTGKSTICEWAVKWAKFYGFHPYTMLIGSSRDDSGEMFGNIKTTMMNNDHLLEDFPEVLYPIRKLEGQTRRAVGQLHHGNPTNLVWAEDRIVFPNIPGSPASGCCIRVAGITGSIRGKVHAMPDGERVRPSLVIIDDPQTRESANSPSQCVTRERIVGGDILGLAGPGKKIAGIMPTTVIAPGDMSDCILDRSKNPEWNGERMKLVYDFPTNTKMWDKYKELYDESFEAHGDFRLATEFYSKNREAMDKGAKVAWDDRYNDDEISAIQNAMNLMFRDEYAFWAEYQNEPMGDDDGSDELITAEQITSKTNSIKRGIVPSGCSTLTAFIDVQGKALYYGVVAWEDNFTGYLIDYGAYPDQKTRYFTLRQIKKTLRTVHKGTGPEGAIYAGLTTLTDQILGKSWKTANGGEKSVDRCLIDAAWGDSTDTVFLFCRQSSFKSILTPSFGQGIGAANTPMNQIKKKKGDKVGHNWRMPYASRNDRSIRHLLYDTNYWKTFLMARLSVSMGDTGCFSLFGSKPETHEMLADHFIAEKPVVTEGRGRTVHEWKLIKGRDNHLLDVTAGNCVAAAMCGVSMPEMAKVKKKKAKKRIKLSEIRRG